MLLSIIILHFNTPDLVRKCVDSIYKTEKTNIFGKKIEIIVADNNSDEENISKLEDNLKSFKEVIFVKNDVNYGFGKGCNLASKNAKGDFILFLNSDATLYEGGLISMVERNMGNKSLGILGGKMLNTDGTDQLSAGKFFNLLNTSLVLLGLEKFSSLRISPKNLSKVDWVSGGFMLIRKKLFDQFEGFDENFFMYVEDMEICYRVSKLGLDTYFDPGTVVIHSSHGSSNRGFAVINIYKGIKYFFRKHKSFIEYLLIILLLKCKAVVIYLFGLLSNNSYYRKTYREALRI